MELQVRNAPQAILQEHWNGWKDAGLLTGIDRAINKDTESHPLARWQFQGGLRERSSGAASCSPNPNRAKGERYDIPVAAGVLAASAESMPPALACQSTPSAICGSRRWRIPSRPICSDGAPRQEAVITGEALTAPGGGLASLPVPISTPGFELRALSDGDALRHARSRKRHPQYGHLSCRPQSTRPPRRGAWPAA